MELNIHFFNSFIENCKDIIRIKNMEALEKRIDFLYQIQALEAYLKIIKEKAYNFNKNEIDYLKYEKELIQKILDGSIDL